MRWFPSRRKALAGGSVLALVAVVGAGQFAFEGASAQDASASAQEAPRFEVDPFWPKPMPNNWALGQAIGVAVDKDDNIWIIHRGWDPAAFDPTDLAVPPEGSRNAGQVVGECCNPSPPVMQFDQEGNLLQAWGGPTDTGEYEWPASNHGIAVDDEGHVYIGGNGGSDAHVLKFTSDGEFVAQWGASHARMVDADGASVEPDPLTGYAGLAPGGEVPEGFSFQANSMDMENFGRVAKVDLDQEANEAYLSDGYGNHRVAVVDMDSGEIKRFWGAYGEPPTDEDLGPYDPSAPPARQFRNPVHCANVSDDGLVYVCDRPNNRVQIFQEDGTFVQEVFVAPETLYDGSVWDIDFSADPEQRYLYMADGQNEHLRVFDRETMQELYNFGTGGRQPGMWMGLHSIAVDSQGNLYTTETYTGKRLQKFVNMGMAPAAPMQVAWPG